MSANSFVITEPVRAELQHKTPLWTASACMFTADALAFFVVYLSTILVQRFFFEGDEASSIFTFGALMATCLVQFHLQGLYPGMLISRADEIRRVILAATFSVLILIASLAILQREFEFLNWRLVLPALFAIPGVLWSRRLARAVLSPCRWFGASAVVFGTFDSAQRVVHLLQRSQSGMQVVGVLLDDHLEDWPNELPPVIGSLRSVPDLQTSNISYAVIALPQERTWQAHTLISESCAGFRHVLLMPELPGVSSLGVSAREIGTEIAFEIPQRLFQRRAAATKRILDACLSALLIAACLPFFPVIALSIKLGSQGPLFFRHRRYGRRGRTFEALKFRTMVSNGDEVLQQHLLAHPSALLEWQRTHKLKVDPRVTWAGRWLRRFSLDELPQLLNVLRGEMSLVGPRPIVQSEIARYGKGFRLYSRVTPGITGLWQISGRSKTSFEERISLDEHYVRNWSVWLDFYILLKTARTVITAEGAY